MRSPLRPKNFSISCIFLEIFTKSYVGAPPRVGAPPTGNPGSAPGIFCQILVSLATVLLFHFVLVHWIHLGENSNSYPPNSVTNSVLNGRFEAFQSRKRKLFLMDVFCEHSQRPRKVTRVSTISGKWGHQSESPTYYWTTFCQILHEEGGASKVVPCRSATGHLYCWHLVDDMSPKGLCSRLLSSGKNNNIRVFP